MSAARVFGAFWGPFIAVWSTAFVPAMAQADVVIPEELPAQCYQPEKLEGIPTSYQRESIIKQPDLVYRADVHAPFEPTPSRPFYCAAFTFSLDERGRPIDIITLYNSHPDLDGVNFAAMAEETLKKWRFAPGEVDGAPSLFLGLSTVFYAGFDEYADISQLQLAAAETIENDYVAESWQSYGRQVTQAELELLEQEISPDAVLISGGEEALQELVPPEPEKPEVAVIQGEWVQDTKPIFIDEHGNPTEELDADTAISEPYTLTGEPVPVIVDGVVVVDGTVSQSVSEPDYVEPEIFGEVAESDGITFEPLFE